MSRKKRMDQDTFLGHLKDAVEKGGYKPRVRRGDEEIRLWNGDENDGFCPVTAVTHYITGIYYDVSQAAEAAIEIGLITSVAQRIATVSDYEYKDGPQHERRKKILSALGLTSRK